MFAQPYPDELQYKRSGEVVRQDAPEEVAGSPPLALVTGANGYVGDLLIPRLLEAGWRVRALVRDPRLGASPLNERIQVQFADMNDPVGVRKALADVDVAFYLVHDLKGGKGLRRREQSMARIFVRAAAAASVGRIVYLGGLRPTGRASTHLRSRMAVGDTFLDSNVPAVVLQSAIIIGANSIPLQLLRCAAETLPILPERGWFSTRCQPIAESDVLHYLMAAASAPLDVNQEIDIGGPDVLTYGEMIRQCAVIVGRRSHGPHVSALLRLARAPGAIHAQVLRRLLAGLGSEVIVRDARAAMWLGEPANGLTGFGAAAAAAIGCSVTADQGWPPLRIAS